MTDHQRSAGVGEILDVMEELGRAPFLPKQERPFADLDMPLPIGHGQTNSQPSTVVNMLELLQVRPGQSVLDVGCGSGWTTAILGRLVGAAGHVIGVERIPELTRSEAKAVADQQMDWVVVRQSIPGVLGLPEEGPYDRILVSADANEFPDELVAQLAPGGILVAPVRSVLHRVRKDARSKVTDSTHGLYAFVPLITDTRE